MMNLSNAYDSTLVLTYFNAAYFDNCVANCQRCGVAFDYDEEQIDLVDDLILWRAVIHYNHADSSRIDLFFHDVNTYR